MKQARRDFLISGGAAAATFALPRSAQAALTTFSITCTHYPEQDYGLPIVVAQQLGQMAKLGIDVKAITGSSGGGTTVRNVTQGGLALGQVATSAGIKAILAGEDLKIIGGGVMTPGTICWVVKKDSPIKSIKDLAGKSVGFTQPGSVSESLLALSLKAAGVDPSSVKTRAAGGIGENYTLLSSGGLDAAFTVDPVLTEHAADLRVIFFARDYVKRFLQTVWVTDSATLRDQSSQVAAFLRGWTWGVEYTASHATDAAKIFAKAAQQDVGPVTYTLQHEQPAQYFGKGNLDKEALSNALEAMRFGKLLGPEKIDGSKFIDQSALQPSLRTSLPTML